jgi:serine/threonine-protein kinase
LHAQVQAIADQKERDQAAILRILERLEETQSRIESRITHVEAVVTPEEAAGWKAVRRRLRDLILLVTGATASAIYQTVIQEEAYPALKARLEKLLAEAEPTLGPAEDLVPPPETAPTPAPTPKETRPPAQVRTPEPEQAQPTTWRGPLEFDWVEIPAGSFLMGSNPRVDPDADDGEQPQDWVFLPTFWLSRTPVTNLQFIQFIEATDYETDAERWRLETAWYQPRGPGSALTSAKADHPVVWLSWNDILAFCRWASVRLPTEAEWEKAARGIDGRIHPWGNKRPSSSLCNFNGNVGETTSVGAYLDGASPYGVLDMSGNVWERTSSLFCPYTLRMPGAGIHYNYPYRANDGREDLTHGGSRIARGGSWGSLESEVRCACRFGFPEDPRADDVGFRAARGPLK